MPYSLSRQLGRFSIKQQILLGYVPVLLLLAVIAVSSYRSFYAFSENFENLTETTREQLVFNAIEKDMLELQRNVLVYSYVGYRGIVMKIERLQKKLELKIEQAQVTIQNDPRITDRFVRLVRNYHDYKEAFAEAVRKRGELVDIKQNTLVPTAIKAEELLHALLEEFIANGQYKLAYYISDLEYMLVKVDANAKIFEASPDATLIQSTIEMVTEMEQSLAQLKQEVVGVKRVKLEQFEALLEKYKNSFNTLINLNRVYLQLVNVVLAGKAAEIDRLSKELDEIEYTRSKELSVTIKDSIADSRQNYFSLSLVAGLLGIISALAVATGIAKPVRQMAEILSRLATGQSDTEIPGQTRRDELGDMAKAADEFKTMSLQVTQQAQEIRESQAFLSAIVDNMNDGLITIDREGAILSYNNACEQILGYDRSEVLGTNIKFMMPDPYRTEHDGYLQRYHETGTKHIIGAGREVVAKRKDGSIFPIDLSVSEVDLPERTIYSGIIRDITDRRQAEEALLQANAELEEFAYRTSHDLRSPLVSSIGLLKIAEQSIDSGKPEKAVSSIQMATKSMHQLEVLVRDILALTQTKNAEEEIEPIDLVLIVSDALEKFSHMEDFDRLEIATEIQLDGELMAKKSRVSLILENLISNAIKYQDAEKPSPFIRITATQDGKHVHVSVEDNGLGIPKDKQDEMFGMFRRFHPKTSFGSGLGLYMMKKSAEVLRGTIIFEDTGQGSKFTLSLPV